MKKNNNMKTISGKEAVLMPGEDFFFPFENLDIVNHFVPTKKWENEIERLGSNLIIFLLQN